MTKEVILWNISKTASVKASKIRSFTIHKSPSMFDGGKIFFEVEGWYNKDEYFYFGDFLTEAEAQDYLDKIHKQIEI